MNKSNNDEHSSPLAGGDGGKTLLLIRHAKSSWDISSLNDFERPLNERGKKDAPAMAKRLIHKKINVDAFVSSPAKRAKKTAELFCTTYNKNLEDIVFVSALYHPSAETIFSVVEQLDNKFSKTFSSSFLSFTEWAPPLFNRSVASLNFE